ncbi:MAG: aminotransferase class I/II-fold pyridoxal phosphate-dependent enzyme [Aggregatilineales bacterium]
MTPHNRVSLDPANWEDFRASAHTMLDDMIDNMRTVRDRPVWQPMPDEIRAEFTSPMPESGSELNAVYDEFTRTILTYPLGNTHPRFWAWVIGSGVPVGVLAELLASTMNPNAGGGDHSANEVEKQVINWSKQMFGFPEDASGLLVSGGSMANFVGLAVARHNKAPYDVRAEGVQGQAVKMIFYASEQLHSSVTKALQLLGIGKAGLRLIPTNDQFEIDVDALEAQIHADKTAGQLPVCVVGSLGTVNTGAVDDLQALRDLTLKHDMWLHIDGAFGAMAVLAPQFEQLRTVVGQADSLAFDFHKWLYIPYEAGCALVRNHEEHIATFAENPAYLAHQPRGAASGQDWFTDYGLQLSRGFKALKIWFALKVHGMEDFRQSIQQNMDHAAYLAEIVSAHPDLELVAPVPMNIVCFRYVVAKLTDSELDALNKEILFRIQEAGIAVPSYTTINERFAIRCAITNHRSTFEDFALLVETVLQFGQTILAENVAG